MTVEWLDRADAEAWQEYSCSRKPRELSDDLIHLAARAVFPAIEKWIESPPEDPSGAEDVALLSRFALMSLGRLRLLLAAENQLTDSQRAYNIDAALKCLRKLSRAAADPPYLHHVDAGPIYAALSAASVDGLLGAEPAVRRMLSLAESEMRSQGRAVGALPRGAMDAYAVAVREILKQAGTEPPAPPDADLVRQVREAAKAAEAAGEGRTVGATLARLPAELHREARQLLDDPDNLRRRLAVFCFWESENDETIVREIVEALGMAPGEVLNDDLARIESRTIELLTKRLKNPDTTGTRNAGPRAIPPLPPGIDPSGLLVSAEAGRRKNVPPGTITRAVRRGDIIGYDHDGNVLVDPNSLKGWKKDPRKVREQKGKNGNAGATTATGDIFTWDCQSCGHTLSAKVRPGRCPKCNKGHFELNT